MDTFTIRFDLTGYDLTPGDKVKILAEPLITSYPDPASNKTYTNNVEVTTDAQGSATMTLVSLPLLQYRIESWALGEKVVSGDWPADTVLRWEDLADLVPSPIQPVDAAALRAELRALIQTEGVGPQGPPGAPGAPGPAADGSDVPDLTLLFENGLI